MNRKKNKETNNRLEGFIDKNDPVDDFEKEALEGFSAFDKEELINAQMELDARFSSHLVPQANHSRRGYWMAAAALLVVSGFTGYFLLQNTRAPKDLALQQPSARHTPPQTPEEKVAEPTPPVTPPAPSMDKPQTFKAKGPADNNLKPEKKSEHVAEPVTTQVAASEEQALAYEPAPSDQKAATAAGFASNSAPSVSPSRSDDELDMGQQKESPAKKRSKKQAEIESAAPAMASDYAARTQILNSAYYQKGEKALQQVIAEKLSAKGLLQRFDARLYINKLGVVDSLGILKAYQLTDVDQKKIKSELKGLDGFVVAVGPTGNLPAEYLLSFVP